MQEGIYEILNRRNDLKDFMFSRRAIMKKSVFWDINTQFVPHRKHIKSPLHIPAVNSM
jgi:hypothetical protein